MVCVARFGQLLKSDVGVEKLRPAKIVKIELHQDEL
jgi:hypothetical protein